MELGVAVRIHLAEEIVWKRENSAQLESRHSNTEPRADRGPQPGSPAGVVDATGCQSQPPLIQKPLSKATNLRLECNIRSLSLAVLYESQF